MTKLYVGRGSRVKFVSTAGVTFYEQEDINNVMESLRVIYETDDKEKNIEKKSSFEEIHPTKKKVIIAEARERALAIIFVMNSNDRKYRIYKQQCYNAMNKGRDEYPKSLVEAHTELEDFKFDPKHYQVKSNNKNRTQFSAHQFYTDNGDLGGQDEVTPNK